jgi:hypothetical protein
MRFFTNGIDRDTWKQICQLGESKNLTVAFIINYGVFEVTRQFTDDVIYKDTSFIGLTKFVTDYKSKGGN